MSYTPKTDEAFLGTITRHGEEYEVCLSASMRELENAHQDLLKKLHALSIEWENCDPFPSDYEQGIMWCGNILSTLVKESKQ